MTVKVINFYAPPSSGKSTLAAACYVEMGYEGKAVQQVDEFIKPFADRKELKPTRLDQLWIMGNQSHTLVNAIRAGYSHIFCHSDPMLCAWFAEWYTGSSDFSRSMTQLALNWEKAVSEETGTKFYRFFIELPEVVYRERYKESGRWEKFEEAMSMQKHMKEWITRNCQENLFTIHETRPEQVFKRLKQDDNELHAD